MKFRINRNEDATISFSKEDLKKEELQYLCDVDGEYISLEDLDFSEAIDNGFIISFKRGQHINNFIVTDGSMGSTEIETTIRKEQMNDYLPYDFCTATITLFDALGGSISFRAEFEISCEEKEKEKEDVNAEGSLPGKPGGPNRPSGPGGNSEEEEEGGDIIETPELPEDPEDTSVPLT